MTEEEQHYKDELDKLRKNYESLFDRAHTLQRNVRALVNDLHDALEQLDVLKRP